MLTISLNVNGKPVSGEIEERTLLVQFLREHLKLTGTHVGCDTSQCGACVIHVDGVSVKSCTMLAIQAEGCEVTTIEGLASDQGLHPMQQAFKDNHGLQNRNGSDVDEATVRKELEGNICRCTGYHNIVKAIQAGAKNMGAQ